MHTHSLFTLLGERLMMHTNTVSITTYNTLYEVTPLQKQLRLLHLKVAFMSTFSSPTCADSDRAGLHSGGSQAPP